MSWLGGVHGKFVHPQRVHVLSEHFARIIPQAASLLDVGCGDGQLAREIMRRRSDLSFKGIDVLVRPEAAIAVSGFDGTHIPFQNCSFDVVMFADVLHHTEDPMVLLREAARVGRHAIVIKDHLLKGALARATLTFMDRVGNKRHRVALPYNYWPYDKWMAAFNELGLTVDYWEQRLRLYPFPANLFFDRALHYVSRLGIRQ